MLNGENTRLLDRSLSRCCSIFDVNLAMEAERFAAVAVVIQMLGLGNGSRASRKKLGRFLKFTTRDVVVCGTKASMCKLGSATAELARKLGRFLKSLMRDIFLTGKKV